MKYELTAGNTQGATVRFYGDTIKSVLNQFKNEYYTKGWRIEIYKNDGQDHIGHKIIKSTYR